MPHALLAITGRWCSIVVYNFCSFLREFPLFLRSFEREKERGREIKGGYLFWDERERGEVRAFIKGGVEMQTSKRFLLMYTRTTNGCADT